jgi:DNA repair exonuclease SbcCD ATPase subunit
MKYIIFKKLHIKNFLSVGTDPVIVEFNRGLNIITGINRDKEDRRNGVGKSTIADAIYFAVFGNTIRELKKEHITNNITQETCEVILYFDVQQNNQTRTYKIVRTLGPTKCYIYVDGEDKTRDSIVNTNELISSVINSSPEVFQNCVIMTVNNTVPFMAKKKLEKRRFIEGIFNLQVFSSMLNNARSELNEIMKDFNVECARYEEISNTLDTYTVQQKELFDQQQLAESTLQERKSCNLDKIKNSKVRVKGIKLIDIEDTQSKISKLNHAKVKLEESIEGQLETSITTLTKIDTLNERISRVRSGESICSSCLRPLKEHDVSNIHTKKKDMNQQLNELQTAKEHTDSKRADDIAKLSKINTTLQHLDSLIYKNDLYIQEIENLKKDVLNLTELNNQIDDDIKHLKHDDTSISGLIKTTELKLNNIQELIDSLKNQISVFEVIKFIVSEEGVKSYIVKKILQLFNSKLAFYLKKMDANCICVFNEYFEEQIIDEKGKICSYFNFSGAERKNIDLACLFAFMDIRRLQGDVAFNFSIYDELFDSSLDEKGVDLVTEILKERIEKYKECIMVISHRKESAKSATGEIIFLEKKNGITTRTGSPSVMV